MPQGGWRNILFRDNKVQHRKEFLENFDMRGGRVVLIAANELIASGEGLSIPTEPLLLTPDQCSNVCSQVLP